VIMDIRMPVMDGIESIHQLRQWESNIATDVWYQNILAVSANSDESTRRDALLAGADAFDMKPLRNGQLIEGINLLYFLDIGSLGFKQVH
jgi:CheY-like chemotaxis protein